MVNIDKMRSRPVMQDRLTLVMNHNYIDKDSSFGKNIIENCRLTLKPYYSNRSKTGIRFEKYGKGQYIILDSLLKDTDYLNYCSHIRMRTKLPFVITADFNFIRYVRHYYKKQKQVEAERSTPLTRRRKDISSSHPDYVEAQGSRFARFLGLD